MDNQLLSSENMSVSAISAMANVKEVNTAPKNYLHTLLLIGMIIFAVFVVGLSVINFEGFVVKQDVKVINAQTSHSQDIKRLTNQ
jgi:hypothetical protein